MQSSGVVKHNCRGRVCPACSCKVERRGGLVSDRGASQAPPPNNKKGSPRYAAPPQTRAAVLTAPTLPAAQAAASLYIIDRSFLVNFAAKQI